MTQQATFDYQDFQRWRRPLELAFWPLLLLLNASFNSITSVIDHTDVAAWQPWSWE